MEALTRANDIRSARAELKREMKAGDSYADVVLAHPMDEVDTMKVFDLLLSVPKFGRVKVNKILTRARISPSKTVGGLSSRQREELIEIVRRSTPASRRTVGRH